MTALTDRITEALTGLHIDPSPSVCGCYELTPKDATLVAERIAEIFTEDKYTYEKYDTKAVSGGKGAMAYGGQVSRSVGFRTVHRWLFTHEEPA